jgi:hypothetical protein
MLTRVKFFCSFLKLIFFSNFPSTFAFLVIELQISFIFSLYEVTLLSLNFSLCHQIRLLIPLKIFKEFFFHNIEQIYIKVIGFFGRVIIADFS